MVELDQVVAGIADADRQDSAGRRLSARIDQTHTGVQGVAEDVVEAQVAVNELELAACLQGPQGLKHGLHDHLQRGIPAAVDTHPLLAPPHQHRISISLPEHLPALFQLAAPEPVPHALAG